MIKKVIVCDKCGGSCENEYMTIYRVKAKTDEVIGRGDICTECYKVMLIALKDSGRWKTWQ